MHDTMRHVPWSIGDILIATGIALALIIIGVFFFHPWLSELSPLGWAAGVILQCMATVPVILCLVHFKYGKGWESLGFCHWLWKDGAVGCIVGFALFSLAQGIGWSLTQMQWGSGPTVIVSMALREWNPAVITIVILSLGVWGPFWEELFFRGFLFPVLRQRWGHGVGVLFSAALFTLAHGEAFPGFLVIFIMGVILTETYEWTGSLPVVIMAHGIHNLLTLGMMVLLNAR